MCVSECANECACACEREEDGVRKRKRTPPAKNTD